MSLNKNEIAEFAPTDLIKWVKQRYIAMLYLRYKTKNDLCSSVA